MLKQTSMQNIMNIVMVLGFLAHGYATDEFEVTEERLGIYLPVRHPSLHLIYQVVKKVLLGRTHRCALSRKDV